jgi:hypothetical protein
LDFDFEIAEKITRLGHGDGVSLLLSVQLTSLAPRFTQNVA